MGKALIIPNVSFATNNLGQITFVDGLLRSITIVGSDSISGVSTYTVSYYPQNTEHTGVEWTVLSGNATINQDTGVLTPSADGTVVIQALSTYDQSIVATKTISVSIIVPLTSISIYGSDSIDNASTYSVIYNPQNTTQTGVTWSVLSGPATITQAGLLTPSGSGTVVIEATSTYNAQVVATKTITVSMEIPVESISIVGDSLISGQGTYSIAYNPSNTTQQGVTWSVVSGNATITQQGVLTASGNGEVIIQAVSTYNAQVVATKTVTVSMVISLVSLSIVGDTDIEGETTYSVAYNPTNTTETGVTWEVVSGPATITQGGVLTPSADGEIVIRATSTQNPSISASKTVTSQYGHDYSQDYFTIESLEDSNTVSIHNVSCDLLPTVYYSTDNGQTWSSVSSVKDSTVNIATIDSGDKLLLKCTTTRWANENSLSAYNSLQASKTFNTYGNAMSLLKGDNFASDTILSTSALSGLLKGSKVVDASNMVLPSTTLAGYCYATMFEACSYLTLGPVLPATSIANDCYRSMFFKCTALTVAPALPATTLAENCYRYMFGDCTELVAGPLLPATTLVTGCYYSMFIMEQGYSPFKLSSITCLATNISASQCTYRWVHGINNTGTFTKAAGMTGWGTGSSGIPSGWTVQDYVEPSNNE